MVQKEQSHIVRSLAHELGDDRWNLCAWIGAKAGIEEMANLVEQAVLAGMADKVVLMAIHEILGEVREEVLKRAKGDGGEGKRS